MPTLRVAVGSANPVKVASVKAAFAKSFGAAVVTSSHDVASGVSDQPYGDLETRTGALERAAAALRADADADYAVGLEGGVVDAAQGGLESVAWMAVTLAPRPAATSRDGVVPAAALTRLLRGEEPGYDKMELGDADDVVFSDVGSKRKGGAIAKVTRGARPSGYYEHALICALVPFLHDATGLYDDAEPATVRKKRRASAAASPAKKPKREAYVAASAWPEVGEPCRFLSGSRWFDGFVVERNAEGGVDMKFADKKYKGYRGASPAATRGLHRVKGAPEDADHASGVGRCGAMVKVSPTWVFMVVAFAALVVVHHSNTHVGLLDARERRHAEEVKRLRAMIDHAQRSADAGGAPVAPADAPPPAPAAASAAATLASFAAELPRDASDPAHGSVVVRRQHARPGPQEIRRGVAALRARRAVPLQRGRGGRAAQREARQRQREPAGLARAEADAATSLVLRTAEGAAAYFLFAEDDMKLCGHGLFAAEYVVRRAERAYPNFMAVRASFGMNGIFIHDADIAHFSAYMLAHQARRPPDHLVVEWFAGETEESRTYRGDRQHLGFRWNFFDHIGARSTLRAQTSGKMPACYEELLAPVVFPVDAYHPKRCPNHDFTPCGNLRTPSDDGAMRRFRAR
ncbi:hypothetical protein JL722_14640 [Aureococcus anophagefferens]|nr:hypothetical protein JL722_14640 [Aureococcus anophagefferens]